MRLENVFDQIQVVALEAETETFAPKEKTIVRK